MTFNEYCNQGENPERHPKVYLTRGDIYASWAGYHGEYVQLAIPRQGDGQIEHYVYFVEDGKTRFYTTDPDGNKLRPSVFRWVNLAAGRLLPYLGDQLN